MSTHKKVFYEDLTKIILYLSSNMHLMLGTEKNTVMTNYECQACHGSLLSEKPNYWICNIHVY